jgi:hypothetical protein
VTFFPLQVASEVATMIFIAKCGTETAFSFQVFLVEVYLCFFQL